MNRQRRIPFFHLSERLQKGETLFGLVVTLFVLVCLTFVITPIFSDSVEESRTDATTSSLTELRDLISQRFAPDMANVLKFTDGSPIPGLPYPSQSEITGGRQNHPQLKYLFDEPSDAGATYSAATKRGWNGSYLHVNGSTYTVTGSFTTTFGENGDPCLLDGWGNPLVIQMPTGGADLPTNAQHSRLISAGSNGVIDTPASDLIPSISDREDDIVLFIFVTDTAT